MDSETEPPVVLTNVRHKAALERAERSLNEARGALYERLPPEMIAVDLQEARDSLEEIIGMIKSDDILERIFTNFCIGK